MRRSRSCSGRRSKAGALAAADSPAPLGGAEFDRLMAALGPFERQPTVAAAVSGGPDSMALGVLAHEWARARGGRVLALVVDHGLRPDSGVEARRVTGWLGDIGIGHAVLSWDGPKPAAEIQAAARAARYRLLVDHCRADGVLHLLIAHHRDDQAETFLLRLGRGSGLDGLAAMAAIVETAGGRLLRPLLAVPPARLRATLEARGLPWVDDPSNRDSGFARTRLRGLAPLLAADGVTPGRLGRTAMALGRARRILDGAVAGLLAEAVTPHPAGFCWLDAQSYGAAPDAVARRALTRLLLCVGGGAYPPRSARLGRLHRALADDGLGAGRTLGGCRILARRRGVLVCREPAATAGETPLAAGGSAVWDRRFVVGAPARAAPGAGGFTVRRLGRDGWTRIAAAQHGLRDVPLPGAVRPALPAICDLDGIVAVPHLGFMRDGGNCGATSGFTTVFRPAHPLAPAAFAFAADGG